MGSRAELADLLALWRSRLGYGGAERADERLAVVWRDESDDDLEARIAELGAAVGRSVPRIKGRRAEDLEATWHVVAADLDAADLDRLLRAPLPADHRHAARRLAALERFAPDPRIAHGVLRYMTSYIGRSDWEVPWHVQRILRSYLARGQFASLERAFDEALASMPRPELANRYRLLRAAPAGPPVPEVASTPAPEAPQLAGLWSQHAADPGNLALRAVLADALVEAGDPRGEFIAVQTAIADGNADPELPRRAAQLLKEHADAWAPVPNLERASRRFERGFLVAVRCSVLNEVSIADPMWVTVEDLTIDRPQCALGPLLRRMPLLHTLATRAFDPGEPVPQLRALGTRGLGEPADRKVFPNLEVLAVALELPDGPTAVEVFLRFQVRAARLGVSATVHVGFPLGHLPAALRHREVALAETRYVISRQREVRFDAPGWSIAAPREGVRARVAWVAGSPYDPAQIRAILHALDVAGYREIAIHAEGRVRATIELDVARAVAALGRLVVDFAGEPIDLRA